MGLMLMINKFWDSKSRSHNKKKVILSLKLLRGPQKLASKFGLIVVVRYVNCILEQLLRA